MARGSKAVNTAVKLGVRYGPLAYEALRRGRRPATEMTRAAYRRGNARRQAMVHAQNVIDGSVMPTFLGDQQVWVVFSKDEPVGSHPTVKVPLAELLTHADLSRRIYPVGPSARHSPNLLTGRPVLRRRPRGVIPYKPALPGTQPDHREDADHSAE